MLYCAAAVLNVYTCGYRPADYTQKTERRSRGGHVVQVPTIRVDRYLAVLMLYNSRAMDRRKRGPRLVSVRKKKKTNWEVGGGYVPVVDGRAGSEWEDYRSL